ncbi:MAG: serine/threonine-protein kinase, partial [Planctomycetota bacterium]
MDRFPVPPTHFPTPAADNMTKTRDFLGPYRLARLIRAGSTSQVWEALEDASDERVAIKLLNSKFKDDRGQIASLKHEFAVASDLTTSQRVVKVKEYRVEGGVPFLVMELFSELNLKQALRNGPDSIGYMIDKIVKQAAEGLHFMHEKGYVHRDVKPDNFLVSGEGMVKLIDFTISEKKKTGLAKLFHMKRKVTEGTRSYMAPEQIRRQVCDERADIYSFGCVLFECVTGKPPFTGQTPDDLLSKHLSAQVPSPITSNDNVTKEFATLVKRMIAKRADDRPESFWQFMKEFETTEVYIKRPRKPEVSIFE